MTEKEIKEYKKWFDKFLDKGGKIRNASGEDYQSQLKRYAMAFKNEKIMYPNLSNTRISNIILKTVSYNENYEPQEASSTSFTKEINKVLRRNKIYYRETKEFEKDGKKYKRNVWAQLKSDAIEYDSAGKTKSGRSFRAYKVNNNGNYYYLIQIQSPKEGLGSEWYTFDSLSSALKYVQKH